MPPILLLYCHATYLIIKIFIKQTFSSCNGPGFDPSIRRHSGIWGAADEAVLNIVRTKRTKSPKKILKKNFFPSSMNIFVQPCNSLTEVTLVDHRLGRPYTTGIGCAGFAWNFVSVLIEKVETVVAHIFPRSERKWKWVPVSFEFFFSSKQKGFRSHFHRFERKRKWAANSKYRAVFTLL